LNEFNEFSLKLTSEATKMQSIGKTKMREKALATESSEAESAAT
jgi:hypothetical protein